VIEWDCGQDLWMAWECGHRVTAVSSGVFYPTWKKSRGTRFGSNALRAAEEQSPPFHSIPFPAINYSIGCIETTRIFGGIARRPKARQYTVMTIGVSREQAPGRTSN